MKTINLLLLACSFISLIACGDSQNQNKIFSKFPPSSREYKSELVKQIKSGTEKLTYRFNKYLVIKGKEYLDITIEGSKIRAEGIVLVDNWNIEGLKKTKGMGYRGAKLEGVKLDLRDQNTEANLVLTGVDKIID